MGFIPEPIPLPSAEALKETSGESWTPIFRHDCTFPPEIFREVMMYSIRNPNVNSNRLFRADISFEGIWTEDLASSSVIAPRIIRFEGHHLKSIVVRTLVPRNPVIDGPLDQTCLFYERVEDNGVVGSLVVYIPHISSPVHCPFYHPAVRAIAFLHNCEPSAKFGDVSIQYCFFASEPRSAKLDRTAQYLLAVLHRHGQGNLNGYVKRVNHDVVLPQVVVQDTYARLKAKYAKDLINSWVETTDPGKHVFEDLGIAAFLIELWAVIYEDRNFPGFVDIGCGNGLLVHILLEEGYRGWGFDARRRKSWSIHGPKAQDNLKELVLIPDLLQMGLRSNMPLQYAARGSEETTRLTGDEESSWQNSIDGHSQPGIHNGCFPKGTFIISNHADELTPWTPILATVSESSFIIIPCCSHNLGGSRFRAPPSHESGVAESTYACFVAWASKLAVDCGWEVEKEMLRIPSTRNVALIGRRRSKQFEEVNVADLVEKYGGAEGWEENALKLTSRAIRGH